MLTQFIPGILQELINDDAVFSGYLLRSYLNLGIQNMGKEKAVKDADSSFERLLHNLGEDDLNEILFNWNESGLNEDGTEIFIYVDSRAYGPQTGGADKVDKSEFIEWLLSNAPFDTTVYGKEILEDKEWAELIGKAKEFIQPAK